MSNAHRLRNFTSGLIRLTEDCSDTSRYIKLRFCCYRSSICSTEHCRHALRADLHGVTSYRHHHLSLGPWQPVQPPADLAEMKSWHGQFPSPCLNKVEKIEEKKKKKKKDESRWFGGVSVSTCLSNKFLTYLFILSQKLDSSLIFPKT